MYLPFLPFLNEYFYFGNPSLLQNYIFRVVPRSLDHKELYQAQTERMDSDMLDLEFGAVTRWDFVLCSLGRM